MVGYRVGNPGIVMGGDEIVSWGVAGVQLNWNIYDGQKNWARREQLSAEVKILKKERKKQLDLWEKKAAIKRLQIKKAHRMKAAAVLAHKAAEALAEDLSNALQAGVVSSAEYLDALAAAAKASFRISQAETLKKTASLQLAFVLGESMEF
jgi:outer membrane protein TolC